MGCIVSNNQVTPKRESGIHPTHIDVVQSTWPAIACQKERFGVFVYNSFLSREREMRRLFPRMVLEDGEEKFRMDEREVRRHALLVMDGLGLAIDCLQDPDKLHRFLRLVGVRHYRAGVTPDMLEKLYPAIDGALRMLLESRYNKRTRRAWRSFFSYITGVMKVAIMEADAEIQGEKLKCPCR
ncbi:hypothetical protein BaRGS_00023795 [Batillaria attramentaria]|uniref:Globin n=1 Tax=Batillaria attramentaria TaxID=370345 RepID=A0ABD0KDN0_9CAEN